MGGLGAEMETDQACGAFPCNVVVGEQSPQGFIAV